MSRKHERFASDEHAPRGQPSAPRAASRNQAGEVIAKLPVGCEQMIGKRLRNGVELSGGEWQKMAIAPIGARRRR